MWFFRKRNSAAWDLAEIETPWGDRPSIYAHIQQHISPGEKGLTQGGQLLPDYDRQNLSKNLDEMFGHVISSGQAKDHAEIVHRALKAVIDDLAEEKLARLYELLLQGTAPEHANALLERLRMGHLDAGRFEAIATWIATNAPDRGPVKIAIVLLGCLVGGRQEERRALFMTLGRHDELAPYAAFALRNSEESPDRSVYQLAQSLEGWGRMFVVEGLAGTQDPEIKRWLLQEGFKYRVVPEFLFETEAAVHACATAYTCATTGDLVSELLTDTIDPVLLAGAGDIIMKLITGGQAKDMGDYADGAEVAERYLHHLGPAPSEYRQLFVVGAINRFVQRDIAWRDLQGAGWTAERRSRLGAQCRAIISLPRWRALVASDLDSEDETTFDAAVAAAGILGMDTWENHYQRLAAGRGFGYEWYSLMGTADAARIERVITLAEQRMPLKEEPFELVFGPEWSDDLEHGGDFFTTFLQELQRFPGRGWPLIRAGLTSPLVQHRRQGVRALSQWRRGEWPVDAETLLRTALTTATDSEDRNEIDTLLAGR